jgi:hypothetical protein
MVSMVGWKKVTPTDPMPMGAMKLDRLFVKGALCSRLINSVTQEPEQENKEAI